MPARPRNPAPEQERFALTQARDAGMLRALEGILMRFYVFFIACFASWVAATAPVATVWAESPKTPANIDLTPPLIPIPNARVSEAGLLVGGQPTSQQVQMIHEAGYRTVINLRPASELGDEGEPAQVERLGMTYVSIPVPGPSGLTEANARALRKALDRQDSLPAVVHCSTGQRAAALIGLEAFVVDRVSALAALDVAKRLGLSKLEKALRDRMAAICKADPSRNCEGLR